jgi:AcrR family transcriptional regulator
VSDQRLRMMLAMIEAVGQNGYRATTVADVIARARVSRKTFYQHFANKQDCMLSSADLVSAEGMRRVERAYREAEGQSERVQAGLLALFAAAIENPAALRLNMIEIAAVGPAGIERRERSALYYEGFMRDALELVPGAETVSGVTVKALVGGLSRVLYSHVVSGRHAETPALVADLVNWTTSYYPTPRAIFRQAQGQPPSKPRARSPRDGGRAPGTLAPHPRPGARRGLPGGDHNVSRSFVVHSQRERILDAVANLTAAEGYVALGVERIAEEAALSLEAFYKHFAGKEDAFLVAYEVGHSKVLAHVRGAYDEQGDWHYGVRGAVSALFEFLASEPAFAHIALVDALSATSRSAERSRLGVSAFAQMLIPGLEQVSGGIPPPPVTIEAISGGIFELCLHYALQRRIQQLPELTASATYFALAPFIGGEDAARVATGGEVAAGREESVEVVEFDAHL